jgi:hypothetical protein
MQVEKELIREFADRSRNYIQIIELLMLRRSLKRFQGMSFQPTFRS